MEFLTEIWNEIDKISLPSLQETENLNLVETSANPVLFHSGRITGQYLKLQAVYRYLFGVYLRSQSGIDRLDDRLKQQGFLKAGEEDMDYYQRYDYMGMDYLYLRSFVHIERLTPEQIELLDHMIREKGREPDLKEAARLVEETYRNVLAVSSEHPDRQFEIYPSVFGEGIVRGAAVLIGLKSMADYDSSGMLTDEEEDQKRIRILYSVGKQLETILSKTLEAETVVITEI